MTPTQKVPINKHSLGEDRAALMAHNLQQLVKHKVDLETALWHGGGSQTFDDVVTGVINGDYIVLTCPNSVLVLERVEFPRYSVLHVFLCAGDLYEVKDAQPTMEKMAYLLGCKYLTLAGRAGWERALKDDGWSKAFTVMRKEIPNG